MAITYPAWGPKRQTIDQLCAEINFQRLHPTMQARTRELIEASEGKVGLGVGFRSEAQQRQMFLSRYVVDPHGPVQFEGQRWRKAKATDATAAPPGRSMHEIGLAVDLAGDHAWVVANSSRFALKHFAWVNDEPWHIQPFELPNSRRQYEKDGAPWKATPTVAPPVTETVPVPSTQSETGRDASTPLEVLPGMRGPVVGQLQDVLIRLGLITDSVSNRDEFYGAATQAVVVKFQESNGLKGDGRVGPKTWGALLGRL
jgi:putative peptidoglycan binding protein/D-alanyl-D-alanine carboxypeptidase-like protein